MLPEEHMLGVVREKLLIGAELLWKADTAAVVTLDRLREVRIITP